MTGTIHPDTYIDPETFIVSKLSHRYFHLRGMENKTKQGGILQKKKISGREAPY